MSASVVYAVTESHMAQLSGIACKGQTELPRGLARFLAAICPDAWPDMRLRVEEAPGAGVFLEPRVTVTALHRFIISYEYQGVEQDRWSRTVANPWAASEEEAKARLEATALQESALIRFLSIRQEAQL